LSYERNAARNSSGGRSDRPKLAVTNVERGNLKV